MHKYTLHKRYKSQLKTFAVEVASFQIESHSSLASANRRAQPAHASFALKSTVYMCILTKFFPVRFFPSNPGAISKSENDIFCLYKMHFDKIFFYWIISSDFDFLASQVEVEYCMTVFFPYFLILKVVLQ